MPRGGLEKCVPVGLEILRGVLCGLWELWEHRFVETVGGSSRDLSGGRFSAARSAGGGR